MRSLLFIALLGLMSCQPRVEMAYVDVENPFLTSTIESFRLAAREAMLKKDVSALANHVFLLKRTLPMAWAAVVDSSGTVLMHSEPPAIATVLSDALSEESLRYADSQRPLVRHLWSAEHRPVLDFTLPVMFGEDGHATLSGYVRIGFFAGERAQNWAAPAAGAPTVKPDTRMESATEAATEDGHDPAFHASREASER